MQFFSFEGLITYINLVSVKLYVKINNIFGFCKVFACLIVIFVGVYEICKGNTDNFKGDIFEGTKFKFGSIALAFYNGLWSYDGWSSVTTITEEIKKPEKYVCDKLNAINGNQFGGQILIFFIFFDSQKHSTINCNRRSNNHRSICFHEHRIYDCARKK